MRCARTRWSGRTRYDNAAASLELGIVLATASVITTSKMLLRFAFVLGALGLVLGVLGAVAPSLGML